MARVLVTLVLVLAAARMAPTVPQSDRGTGPQATFKAGVNLIKVAVAVSDADRKFVTGLTRDDFIVYDDGKRQEIATFSSDRTPVSLGILLDASSSNLGPQRWAFAQSVIDGLFNRLAPDDEMFVSEFSDRARMLQTWTTDRDALRRGLGQVRGGTVSGLYDAVQAMLIVARSGHLERKALLVVSDGDNNYGSALERNVRELVRRSDVRVYAMALDELPPAKKANEAALRRLTDGSGGRTRIVQPGESVDEAVQQLAAELGQQYQIAYAPPASAPSRWHDIKVEVRGRKDVAVRAREGYVSN
jgi:VWFA-related protein